MNKYTRSIRSKQRKKLRPQTKDEEKLLRSILSIYNKQVKASNRKKKIDTYEDLVNVLDKIDSKKIQAPVQRYLNTLLKRNRNGFLNIMSSMISTTQNTKEKQKLEEAFSKALPSLIQEKKIYKPYMEKFLHNMGLIKNLPKSVEQDLKKAYEKGEGLRGTEIEKLLEEKLGRRARLIIRTESSKINSALTETRAKSFGIKAYIWSTSGDVRVRPSHKMMDNVLVFWDDPPTLDKMTGHAGEFPNCLPGNELVNLDYGVQKLYRRNYKGKLVTVTLENGTTVSSTPNHPFLSKTGWVALNSFNVGDELFEVRMKNGVSATNIRFIEYDSDKDKPTFEQLFTSLYELGIGRRQITCMSGTEFHNDAVVNEQVDIVDIDCFLTNDRMTSVFKELGKFYLKHPEFTVSTRLFPANCPMSKFVDGVLPTCDCKVCSDCVLGILFRSAFGHHNTVGLQGCSCLDSLLCEYRTDDFRGGAKFFSNTRSSHTAIVTLDYLIRRKFSKDGIGGDTTLSSFTHNNTGLTQIDTQIIGTDIIQLSNPFKCPTLFDIKPLRIVDKFVSEFPIQVYNLQSDFGYYTIKGNICQHNCRCIGLPLFEIDDITFPVKIANNLEIESKYIKGSGGKYKANIVKGSIKSYTKEQFTKTFVKELK